MKTQIIHLEKHDDLTSARDKMNWIKSPRILLVYPRRGVVLQRKVDLVLLQRFGQNLGAQLGVVSGNGEVINHAKDLGIPTFASIKDAQIGSWRKPRHLRKKLALRHENPVRLFELREKLKPTEQKINFKGRIVIFLVGILAVLAIAFSFFPSAQVTLSLKEKKQSIEMDLFADPSLGFATLNGGLPAYQLTVIVEGQDQILATGKARVADTYATGEVTFTNLSTREIIIPAGVILSTGNVNSTSYKTLKETKLASNAGNTGIARVQALIPGISGNVSAGAVQIIEDNAGLYVKVSNSNPISGGTDKISPVPTNEDLVTLRERLLVSLKAAALEEFRQSLDKNSQLLPDTVEILTVIDELPQPSVGQYGEKLRLTMRVEYKVLFILDTERDYVVNAVLDANLPKNYRAVLNTLTIENLKSPEIIEGKVQWRIRADRMIKAHWSAGMAAQILPGKSIEDAKKAIAQAVELSEDPKIEILPAFLNRLPFLAFRIQVVVK
jgi:hypothetical protein